MYTKKTIDDATVELIKRGHSISVAESVTSGHLQAAFSLGEGATQVFQGGITTYNLEQKTRHLNVDPLEAIECNSVSGTIAEQMALHAIAFFSSDWGIAITGYATPVPEGGIDDLFAFFAIAFRDKIILTEKIRAEKSEVLKVQLYYTNAVLEHFLRCLKDQA
jgi:nicotinamide-nucleotide amidase